VCFRWRGPRDLNCILGYLHEAGLGVKPFYIIMYLVQLLIHIVQHAQYSVQLLFDIHLYFTTHRELRSQLYCRVITLTVSSSAPKWAMIRIVLLLESGSNHVGRTKRHAQNDSNFSWSAVGKSPNDLVPEKVGTYNNRALTCLSRDATLFRHESDCLLDSRPFLTTRTNSRPLFMNQSTTRYVSSRFAAAMIRFSSDNIAERKRPWSDMSRNIHSRRQKSTGKICNRPKKMTRTSYRNRLFRGLSKTQTGTC